MKTNALATRTIHRLRGLKAVPGAVPPVGLVVLGILSVQVGAAFSKSLFPAVGPYGTVFLRLFFAALILMVAWRPRVRGYNGRAYLLVLLFGLVFAAMNSSFYAALDRVPLGIAVAVEFVGPLGIAVFGSRRPLDLLWAVLAAGGIVLLTPLSGASSEQIDPVGIALALLAGVCWAAYILISVRVGRSFPGGNGLALGTAVGAVLVAPIGIWQGGQNLLDWPLLATGAAVALLSSVIPYSFELEALRKLPARVFGVLMSIEPAFAVIVGFALLGEALGQRELLAVGLITAASIGATRFRAGRQGREGTSVEEAEISPKYYSDT
jgi:inner membrane transporter RhtA